jgi:hypothetical protein
VDLRKPPMNQNSDQLDDDAGCGSPPGGSADPQAGFCENVDLQRLWLGALRQAWRTLAVVPADPGVSPYEVASLIATLGKYHGHAVSLADLREIRLNRVDAFLAAAQELVARGERVVFATSAISKNLAAIPLARGAEGVILCVSLGATPLRSIADTIEQVGKERFLGSMLVRCVPARQRPAFVAPKRLAAHS